MKKLEILIFDRELAMLKDFLAGDWDYYTYLDETHDLLDTLSKCANSDEYYENYLKYNRELLGESDE